MFVVEGEKIVKETILFYPSRIHQLYVTERWYKNCLVTVNKEGLPEIIILKPEEIKKISSLKNAPECLAIIKIIINQIDINEISGKLLLVLDKVQDPGNLGNIIRIADWFGIHDVICSDDSADCYNPKVLQSTMGAIMRVRIYYTKLNPLLQKLTHLPEFGIYGTFADADSVYDAELQQKGAVIIGNESKGIRKELYPHIAHKITVPSYHSKNDTIDSLNVAAATAIICSEFRRRMI